MAGPSGTAWPGDMVELTNEEFAEMEKAGFVRKATRDDKPKNTGLTTGIQKSDLKK